MNNSTTKHDTADKSETVVTQIHSYRILLIPSTLPNTLSNPFECIQSRVHSNAFDRPLPETLRASSTQIPTPVCSILQYQLTLTRCSKILLSPCKATRSHPRRPILLQLSRREPDQMLEVRTRKCGFPESRFYNLYVNPFRVSCQLTLSE